MKNYLNFENEIKNIEAEIDKLKDPYNNEGISPVDTSRIDKLQSDLDKKLKDMRALNSYTERTTNVINDVLTNKIDEKYKIILIGSGSRIFESITTSAFNRT